MAEAVAGWTKAVRAIVGTLLLGAATSVSADPAATLQPMDLRDPRPRAISVRFETSPPERPDQLATTYTDSLPAWLEPDEARGRVRVTIEGRDIETGFLYRRRPVPGSFSDYVWVFDAVTGDVVSAQLSGTLMRRLEVGPFGQDVATPFAVALSTLARAGFEPPRTVFGQLVFEHCARDAKGCTLVAARRYDPRSGYVNAVGALVARALGVAVETFSPLGEAIFSEHPLSTAARAGAR
jgi:hypothetical protein